MKITSALMLLAVIASVSLATAQDARVVAETLMLGLRAGLLAIPLGLILVRVCLHRGIVSLFMQVVSAWDSAFGSLGWLINVQQFAGALTNSWAPAIWIHAMAAAPQLALISWFGL